MRCSALLMHTTLQPVTCYASQKRPQGCSQLPPCTAYNPKAQWVGSAALYAIAQIMLCLREAGTCGIGVQAQHGTTSRSSRRPWRALDVGVGALDAGLGGVDGGAVGVQAAVRGAAPHSGQSVISSQLWWTSSLDACHSPTRMLWHVTWGWLQSLCKFFQHIQVVLVARCDG